MKKFFVLAIAAFLSSFFIPAKALTLDSEGMPVVYLRGDFGNTRWGTDDNYRFTRNGNDYFLFITESNSIGNCNFKIGDDDWALCDIGSDIKVNSSMIVNGLKSGPNFSTDGLSDCIISFTFDPEAQIIPVSFIVDGLEVEPSPTPGTVDVYLRGDFNGTGWNTVNDRYKFKREGNVYVLDITSDNPVTPGSSFKIGDENWSVVDFGGAQEGISIDYTQNLSLSRSGFNLTTVNGIYSGTISFTYDPEHPSSNLMVYFDLPGTQRPPVSGLSGTLPVLYINVYTDEKHTAFNNEIISKDLNHKNYFEYAEYWLDLNECKWLEDLGAESIGSEEKPLAMQIKARGNWTRIGFSKKPFKLKLDKKQSLLGLSKSKHFAILAHADDNRGYLKNYVGFNLGQRIELPWTPSQQPVEVVINGDYRGLYFLTESIRVEEDRVNITELGDNVEEGRLVSGGYIVELDNYDEDEKSQIRMEEKHLSGLNQHYDMLRITFDTPEEYSDLQRLFITEQFSAMNDYVGTNDNALWSYMDLDDAARYYLVEEIVSHVESYHGSTYLFRDYGDGQKWHFSPLWDFGNAFNGYTDDFFYNCDPFGNTWIPSMRENGKFNDKVKETWLWFMSNNYSGLESDIEEYVGHISEAARADYNRWHDKPVPSGGQPVADNRDMQGKKNDVLAHLNSKINWLKGKFGDYTTAVFAEPERDDTEAAPLPSYVATNVMEIIDIDSLDGNEEYYTLQGIRVTNPVAGNIYIVRRGSKAYKVVVR